MELAEIARRLDTDKASHAHYLRNYDTHFAGLRDRDIRLLELGVYKGGSLRLWKEYFARGVIAGVDFHGLPVEDASGRIRVYKGAQQDTALLDRIARENAPDGFDIIIDDCAHVGVVARTSFWHLFNNHLKSGGIYVIEDWGTGYWPLWVDGVAYPGSREHRDRRLFDRLGNGLWRLQTSRMARLASVVMPLIGRAKAFAIRGQFYSHDYGMVGFVKELVDEVGMADITDPRFGVGPERASRLREIHLSRSHLFAIKA